MNLAVALSAAATLVAIAFCLSTFERWTLRRRRHDAVWSIALAMFAIATGALWLGLSTGWNETIFRIYYLFGAVLNVPVLALGTLYLLGSRRLADRIALGIALWLAVCTGVILATPFTDGFTEGRLPGGSDHLGAMARTLAAVNSATGAIVLIAGAVWSTRRLTWASATSERSQSTRRMATANTLIALGAIILGVGGSTFEAPTPFAFTTTTGITVIFIGFLLTSRPRDDASVFT